jgi:hypothetical protein
VPPKLNVPGSHGRAVALTLPELQAYPAAHAPLQLLEARPGTSPNLPLSHSPLHAALVRALEAPYVPAGHKTQTDDPAVENWPAGHRTAVALRDPGGHAYPATHSPLHAALVRALEAPYVPPGHARHTADPLSLYSPGTHASAVALVLPAGQA